MHRTLDQIRREGLTALRQRLGRSGMIRFLQQFESGTGDYASERHRWVDCLSLEDIQSLAKRRPPGKRAR
ncbi:MAG TPA: hypothetical protein VLM89_01095 [Phycisphaerae bacterium]|nr:hypothetical protein [Phycisphaerae bacterium]